VHCFSSEKQANLPRLVLAGAKSGVGKTTLALGIMRALREKGRKVQPFKIGPDYIDTGLHKNAAGQASHNLDGWMGPPEVAASIFLRNARNAGISIIEGVMGLFDGSRVGGLEGSTAQIAQLLQAPVILIVDVKGMGKSSVALVKGYQEYLPGLSLAAVILNNARGNFQQERLPELIRKELGLKVLGFLPPLPDVSIPERHLGLLPAEESLQLENQLNNAGKMVQEYLDLPELERIAVHSPPLNLKVPREYTQNAPAQFSKKIKIGIARDRAFSFYYQDSLDYLEELGARLHFFSPLNDKVLPPVDGIYLGGGFPEMFLQEISSNPEMRRAVYSAAARNTPLLAECGGFMYLAESVRDFTGNIFPGAGVLPVRMEMKQNLQALGYVEATALRDNLLCSRGEIFRGHEFHYSRVVWEQEPPYAFSLTGGCGPDGRADGYARGNLLASYLHLHLRSNPRAACRFLEACLRSASNTR